MGKLLRVTKLTMGYELLEERCREEVVEEGSVELAP